MRKAKNKWKPRKKKKKTTLCLLQCQNAGCICEIAWVEAAGGMSSSAVAPIKRPRNFQTPTADASTPGELDRTAPLNKPDNHHGTSRASRRHRECASPCWKHPAWTHAWRSFPLPSFLRHAWQRRAVLRTLHPLSRSARKEVAQYVWRERFPLYSRWREPTEVRLTIAPRPSHPLRYHGARWAPPLDRWRGRHWPETPRTINTVWPRGWNGGRVRWRGR